VDFDWPEPLVVTPVEVLGHSWDKPAPLNSGIKVVDVEVIVCATHLRDFIDKKDFLYGNTQINLSSRPY
jgi:hypothetical protein